MPDVDAAIGRVAGLLDQYTFRSSSEKILQESIGTVLARNDLPHRREHRLSPASVVDFYLPPSRVGVEVKTKGSLAGVTRQLGRYARDEAVDGLLLVTTLARLRDLPATLHGKPLRVLTLTGGLL